ncbi:hypothetical protein Tco_1054480 [Tanacetum coccineum]|uniref:Reverse transcriptase/retrotransposon-derived protein RNase H-like domain-containing protein n=1 Tax=Tanacetum coccineum TaxID=301880 RepID=A0ABQ5GZA7_9ASTR
MRYYTSPARKGQILADFLVESPTITDPLEKSIADTPGKNTSPAWTLFTDGAASLQGSGIGLILTDLNGQEESSNISPYQRFEVPNEHEIGVFVTELSRTWKEELQGASYYNDVAEMTLMIKDTIEVTLETNNFPLIGDPSGHLPYVGGLDEHVTIDGLSTEAQYLDIYGNQGASVGVNHACKKQCTLCSGRSRFNANGSGSSGGFVTVNQSNDAAPSVGVGAALGLAHAANAIGPLRWLKRRYESLVVAYQGL